MYRTIKHPDAKVQAAIQRLVSWDGQLTANSIAGTLYLVTKQQMTQVMIAAQVGQEVRDKAVGGGLDPVVFAHSEYQGHDIGLLMDLLNKPDSQWVRNAGGKNAILKKSIEQAVAWLSKTLGQNIDKWQWGKLHTVTFPHPMAVKKPLDYIFNVGPFPIGGDTDTVCQTAFKPYKPYEAEQACPSYRHIVDMSNFANSLWILPPGQSGQIGSKHYDDQVQNWLNGKYYPMMWEREQIEAGAKQVLMLKSNRPH
jgi:penicillin amidase